VNYLESEKAVSERSSNNLAEVALDASSEAREPEPETGDPRKPLDGFCQLLKDTNLLLIAGAKALRAVNTNSESVELTSDAASILAVSIQAEERPHVDLSRCDC